jgi:hypothetical protein
MNSSASHRLQGGEPGHTGFGKSEAAESSLEPFDVDRGGGIHVLEVGLDEPDVSRSPEGGQAQNL